MNLKQLNDELSRCGLALRGIAPLSTEQQSEYGLNAAAVALVGNVGPGMWPVFSSSPEYHDGLAHPLDRWSQRVAAEMTERFGLQAVFPFRGPPYLPFQRWASLAEALEASPLGLLMHPEYGLWHAYRFALLLPELDTSESDSLAQPAKTQPICSSCSVRPCLSTCPAQAISAAGYDVAACMQYLESDRDASCHRQGCMARAACPQAPASRYEDAQSCFHLKAFFDANRIS